MTNVFIYLFLAVLIVDKLFFNPNITGGNNIWNWVLWSRYHVGNITITIQLNNTTITLDTASSTHNTQNITFPQFCFNPFYHLLFSRAATLAYQGKEVKLVPKYGRYKCGKNAKSLPKVRKNCREIDMKWAKTVGKWPGCLLYFEDLRRPWLFEEKIPRRRKYVNNKYSFLGSIPPLAAIGVWYRLVPTLTSLVFQRCLWLGKWSDLGSDSRLSGSLIGSPSANRWRSNQHIWNKYLGFVVIISDSWTDGWEDKLLAVTYVLMILMVNFKDG